MTRVTRWPDNRPPAVLHDAVVGPEGVVCLEAHQ